MFLGVLMLLGCFSLWCFLFCSPSFLSPHGEAVVISSILQIETPGGKVIHPANGRARMII